MKTLSVGITGPEVCILQTRLNSKPPTALTFLSADGIFGPKTLARTKEFQRNNQLVPDGIVGPKTWGRVLTPQPIPETASRFCDDGIRANANSSTAQSIHASFKDGPPSTQPPLLASIGSFLPSLPSFRSPSAAEVTMATGVYGGSIDFSTVFLSDKTGLGGRAFVLTVPVPFGRARQIMNVGTSPSPSELIHEFAHVWQSQHHSDPTRYMVNAVASQALAEATNAITGSTSFSAYGYRPGKPFGEYAAEQIAQQAMRGEAPIVAHMRSLGPGVVDPDNTASLGTSRIEDTSLPGVKT